MDDHDQPMTFLELPWTHCIATCKALAYDRLSLHVAPLAKAMEPGWGLASSQVDVCKIFASLVSSSRLRGGRGCRNLVAFQQLRQSFSNSNALGTMS